jgi:hypothetical protein
MEINSREGSEGNFQPGARQEGVVGQTWGVNPQTITQPPGEEPADPASIPMSVPASDILTGSKKYGDWSILGQKQTKVNSIAALLESSLAQRPAVFDLLPDDPQVVEWRADHDRLLGLRDEAIKEREKFRATMSGHNEASKYEDTPGTGAGIITRLRYQEGNLVARLRGSRIGAWPEGGVASVK